MKAPAVRKIREPKHYQVQCFGCAGAGQNMQPTMTDNGAIKSYIVRKCVACGGKGLVNRQQGVGDGSQE